MSIMCVSHILTKNVTVIPTSGQKRVVESGGSLGAFLMAESISS